MSEVNPQTLTIEQVAQDYANTCAQLGEVVFRKSALDKQQEEIFNQLLKIDAHAKLLKGEK